MIFQHNLAQILIDNDDILWFFAYFCAQNWTFFNHVNDFLT